LIINPAENQSLCLFDKQAINCPQYKLVTITYKQDDIRLIN